MGYQSGIRVEEVKSCLLCGRIGECLYDNLRDRQFSAPGVWAFWHCPSCGLIWLKPRPVSSDVGKLYADYYTHRVEVLRRRFARIRRVVKRAILETKFGYQGSFTSPSYRRCIGKMLGWIWPLTDRIAMQIMYSDGARKGRLLDVGCGSGEFLAQMRELGWEVFGVEPDPQAARVAREQFGLTVWPGALAEASFPDGFFDAVTLNHVIEHVADPLGLLQKCHQVVKPGGSVTIITPNGQSLVHRLLRRFWRELDPPRHLYIFIPDTLSDCVKRAGLKLRFVRSSARKAGDIWSRSRLVELKGNASLDGMEWRLQFEGALFAIAEQIGQIFSGRLGEEILLVATKETPVGFVHHSI